MLKPLATAAATTTEVVSVTPATSLVHRAFYDVTVQYRDQAGNTFATQVLTGMECDVETDPIVSNTPDQTVRYSVDVWCGCGCCGCCVGCWVLLWLLDGGCGGCCEWMLGMLDFVDLL